MYTTTCPNTSLRPATVRTRAVCMAYAREKCMEATHHLIPPGAKTGKIDVESFH